MGASVPECLRLVIYVLVIILGSGAGWGEGCRKQEKLALLQLKPFFNRDYALYDWVEEEGKESSDCCKWERVDCDATIGSVIGLSLENQYEWENPYESADHSWYLNTSLFLPFQELKSLSLSGNQIEGCLVDEGFEKLSSKLKKLETLDLSDNRFNDSSILSSLVQFSSLNSLNLSYNYLGGPIISHTSAGLGGLSRKLSIIEILDLKNNELDDNILLFLSELSSLKYLDLSSNQITSSNHTISGFEKLTSELKKLEVLYLSSNHLNDSNILSSLVEFSSLKSLNLSYNDMSGPISHTSIGLGALPRKLSVIETLNLEGNRLDDNIWVFLSELSTIKYLDLSGNLITARSNHTISEMVNNLINLKELDLRGNEIKSLDSLHGLINLEVLGLTLNILNSNILSSLGPFSKCLKHLYISYYYLEGSMDIKDARSLKNVRGSGVVAADKSLLLLQQSLSLFPSLNTLRFASDTDNATVTIKGLHLLKNLESLEIEEISLENNFLEKIGVLTSLKILSLPNCGLNGTLSTQDICQLTLLERLDVRENELRGVLPDCFSNLSFLKYLDLSSNQFCGNLSTSPLQSLTSIQYLDLSNNRFQIPSSLKPFFNHSKLKYFLGGNNHIYLETELHSSAPQFQLNAINLSCCGDAGPLPNFLFHQHELQSVDLSDINLTGEFPSWLLGNNTELKRLFLINNSLSGNFLLPFHSPMKLLDLDVSKNSIDGHIPLQIGVCLPGLRLLNISINSLNGSIPPSIGDMKLLQILDLSNNILSGEIPENLATCCPFLKILALSNNSLQGQIFSANLNLTNLVELYLDGNNFTGSIPNSLSNCSLLSKIDIGYNNLSGRIPRSIANLSALQIFSVANNHIEGPIPIELCQHDNIGVLDLSMNNISGTLDSCFGTIRYNHVHLSKNKLRGQIPKSICNGFNLVTLDLGNNQFSGNIPNCIGNLSKLRFLVLTHNNLEGEIPNQFCQLQKLSLIDLSHNNLYGRILKCLKVTTYNEISTVSSYFTNRVSSHSAKPAGSSNKPVQARCPLYSSYLDCINSDRTLDIISTRASIELTTKNRLYSYKGRILKYLSGIDLSSNKLIGEIPHEMGNFLTIVMLNLSHNRLIGSIPRSLSNLKELESLDLSYNNLSGSIPSQFVHLYSLSYFDVSYNNLSGRTPTWTAQFATFEENSYLGNPLLCGDPLPKKCSTPPAPPIENEEAVGLIDMASFYVTFIVSYIVVLLSIAAILYINPHWRQAWFYLIKRGIDSCFYFVVDNILPRQLRLW